MRVGRSRPGSMVRGTLAEPELITKTVSGRGPNGVRPVSTDAESCAGGMNTTGKGDCAELSKQAEQGRSSPAIAESTRPATTYVGIVRSGGRRSRAGRMRRPGGHPGRAPT